MMVQGTTMIVCPICGLEERCRNHWVAVQEPSGEVEFQIGAMTASEDNLVMLRNRLGNPPLRVLFAKIGLEPQWVEFEGRLLAYLTWPLELRGAVHRTLFPNGAPGADNRPLPPTPIFDHRLEDLRLEGVEVDLDNCLPDEVLYNATFALQFSGVGTVAFHYLQIVFAAGVNWSEHLASNAKLAQAQGIIQLMLGGLVDPLRGLFAGHAVQVLAEEHPDGIHAGDAVDEVALPGVPERHLGEELDALMNERRLQPLLRDSLLALALSSSAAVN